MPRPWRGCITTHHGYLALRLPDENGKWRDRGIGLKDTPENRKIAERKLAEVREQLQAREAATGSPAPPTVRVWARRWFDDRERSGLTRVEEDRRKLEEHVCSVRAEGWPCSIGELLVEEVRPRHLVEVVERLQAAGAAPRTIRNVYYLARALFRDAVVAELLPVAGNPCVLTKRQLPKVRDARPGWRRTAIFERAELERLISDDRVPEDRRVMYALLGLGMLRHGEAAGLRWSAVVDRQPLGSLEVFTSYDDGTTKTEEERAVPCAPTLAAILAEWRLSGWPRMFGRQPRPEDLVLPTPPPEQKVRGRRTPEGQIRTKGYTYRRWCGGHLSDTDELRFVRSDRLRHRRIHDLRRTGISLYQEDGADRSILQWATHAPPRDVMSLYTTHAWRTLCTEIAKLRLVRRFPQVVGLPTAGAQSAPGRAELKARKPRKRAGAEPG